MEGYRVDGKRCGEHGIDLSTVVGERGACAQTEFGTAEICLHGVVAHIHMAVVKRKSSVNLHFMELLGGEIALSQLHIGSTAQHATQFEGQFIQQDVGEPVKRYATVEPTVDIGIGHRCTHRA